tara:strand:- start:5807 stop:6670 length:864 start_codon:yes stop_codon:yes gene_type:complete
MIKIKLTGGLGNQMFQYAASLALARKLDTMLVIDISFFKKYDLHPLRITELKCSACFNMNNLFLFRFCTSSKIRAFLPFLIRWKKFYFEPSLAFDEGFLKLSDGSTVLGYFQSEKYFLDIRDELIAEFKIKYSTPTQVEKLINKIQVSDSVSIHIRRGDYISTNSASDVHGTCDKSYYNNAIEYLNISGVLNENTILFIFSDDIDWCSKNLNFPYKCQFVKGSNERPELDMLLMSKCKHNIIANSSFSWWGAWLNENENKLVVAPKKWFKSHLHDSKDIVPSHWKKI